MSPHHALPSANVIENPFPEFNNMPTPSPPPVPSAAIPATGTSTSSATSTSTEHALPSISSLPLIPPFRIPWKVCFLMIIY